jgi:hypothetical protein
MWSRRQKKRFLLQRVYADISRRTFDKWSPLLHCLSPAYENKFYLGYPVSVTFYILTVALETCITECELFSDLYVLEDDCRVSLRNVGNRLVNDPASYPRKKTGSSDVNSLTHSVHELHKMNTRYWGHMHLCVTPYSNFIWIIFQKRLSANKHKNFFK